jgi:ArsR family transcriptional regulator
MLGLMTPESVFNIMSDPTRLRALILIQSEGEVCVCELTHALKESQPKISRHLALMRDTGIVEARREGTWMHYRLGRSLPEWARRIVESSHAQLSKLAIFRQDARRLSRMNNRPERICA